MRICYAPFNHFGYPAHAVDLYVEPHRHEDSLSSPAPGHHPAQRVIRPSCAIDCHRGVRDRPRGMYSCVIHGYRLRIFFIERRFRCCHSIG